MDGLDTPGLYRYRTSQFSKSESFLELRVGSVSVLKLRERSIGTEISGFLTQCMGGSLHFSMLDTYLYIAPQAHWSRDVLGLEAFTNALRTSSVHPPSQA